MSNSYFVTHLIHFPGLERTNNNFYNPHRASSVHPDGGHRVFQRFHALFKVRRLHRFHSSKTHKTQTGSDFELLLCRPLDTFPVPEGTNNHFYIFYRASYVYPDSGHGVIQRSQALYKVRWPPRFHSSRTHKTQIWSDVKLILCHTLDTFPRSQTN